MVQININNIKITERIRKEIKNIDSLAEDICRNRLINPITVMKTGDGEIYRLIAGFRRVKAAQMLGWTEIEANVISPADAEAALLIEISENEQREPFTFTEKMEIARIIEEIEKAKGLERMSIGGKGSLIEGVDVRPHLQQGKSRDATGSKIGMSGRTYSRAKYVAEKASRELLQELDDGGKTVYEAYNELRDKAAPKVPQKTASKIWDEQPLSPYMKKIMQQDEERLRRNREWDAMSPAEKIAALEKRVETESGRAIQAENELAKFKEQIYNQIFHRDSIIDNFKIRIKKLESENENFTIELEAARARIAAFEAEEVAG